MGLKLIDRKANAPGRRGRRALLAAILAIVAVGALAVAPAQAARVQKSIWGPTDAFSSDYCPLKAGFYQYGLSWRDIAPSRPANPTDPSDPAYQWPAELDGAIAAADSCGIKVSLLLIFTPGWANGGRAMNVPPKSSADYARFAAAAAERYPSVRHWQIWGEPTRRDNWSLSRRTRKLKLPKSFRRAPRRYASLLDAAYGALKGVSKANVVIGGMTLTRGDILPLAWIRYLRLPNGKPPRFDMYGHNPFTARNPNLKNKQLQSGTYDFSDLDLLAKDVDRNLARRGRHPKIWISEWTVPTDFTTTFLGFYVKRKTQATWLRSALRIARRWKRLYTVGWFQLEDTSAAHPKGPVGWGLRDLQGDRKPSWFAFRDG